MRQTVNLNRKWAFVMAPHGVPDALPEPAYYVNIPHTWNAIDGQDGGGDYYRGVCAYIKRLSAEDLPEGEKLFIEIQGANSSADLYVSGRHAAHHDGGYSAWRADVTDLISRSGDTLIVIMVDNRANDHVYPQMADFTFYGGLYRDVNLIGVPRSHFDLLYHGGPGIAVTPIVDGKKAIVKNEVYLKNAREGQTLCCTIKMPCGRIVAKTEVPAAQTSWNAVIEDVHLWHGRRYPYLYTAIVELVEDGKVLDTVSTRFGCRTFAVDPQRGFILNGEAYPLRGVSRHQDRWGVGNALTREDHREDMQLIAEIGANTIRLAHYQHDQYFYDLCDAYGMIVWAEIPYISRQLPKGRANTISQMRELIAQNYNHPSIVFWGISNEITMKGEKDPELIENHKLLNALCHEMDKTRLTTMAIVSMCPMDAAYIRIPDTVAWNHYFGWYGGDVSMNGPWFDRFHAMYPDIPVGCSEYGCEALNWHTSHPAQGDYTEEYQAHYHEEMIRQLYTRPYLFAAYVWNMFDFGADNRAEGGENGQNHKGLVTFDRRYKKDAFYAYKAWLSDEPFVHLCGKRYVDRAEDVTRVTVYSNQPEVELFANGESLGKKRAGDHFFYFDVPNQGRTKLEAIAGKCRDESEIRRTDVFNESYRLKEKGAVLNWFDITVKEGYFSLNDRVGDIMGTKEGRTLLQGLMDAMRGGKAMGFEMTEGMMQMMNGFTLLRLTGLMSTMNVKFTKEELLEMNRKLNGIRKPQ
ncbi:MAG: glycoside hydrolase family 2 protein [Clostridia bacterium]|nr:glycoside hydrolase family 2 protein [Clostridia bacterium]